MKHHLILPGAMVMILTIALPARAQEGDAAVTATLIKFVDALEAGDARALEQLIWIESPAQERSRTVFAQLAAAQKSLERAAAKRFGEQGKSFRCGFDLITSSVDRKGLAAAKVYYEDGGRVAHVEKAGEL